MFHTSPHQPPHLPHYPHSHHPHSPHHPHSHPHPHPHHPYHHQEHQQHQQHQQHQHQQYQQYPYPSYHPLEDRHIKQEDDEDMDQGEYEHAYDDHDYAGSDGTSTSSTYDNHPQGSATGPSSTSISSSSAKAKGKLFQCTGFGDCRMVFTRSEHLARHARKHTGEKPFKCVVEGCSRMFSRFDNMVQHTQTHTKGAHPDFSEGIAHKIALETRRKSEAGLLSTPSRTSRSKRASTHGSPSKEVPISVPTLSVDVSSMAMYTPSSQSPLLASSASPSSPSRNPQEKRKRSLSKKTAKRNSGHHRTGSLEAPTNGHPETWYASKLHHRPSLDYGLDMYSQRNAMSRELDAHLPPLNRYQNGPHPLDTMHVPHPLSLEGSPVLRALPQSPYHQQYHPYATNPSDNTLPPLRSLGFPPERTRLPSIAGGRFRSQSINFDYAHAPQEALRTRRLSLVDLEAPIQEATQAVHHSAVAPVKESVDVSEDEIQALEAFGELWSGGRNKAQAPQQRQHQQESAQVVPGLDHGRRPVGPLDDTYYGSMELDH
ncbi:hypothetical protein BGZ59_005039 [Podila verticillata]|nr:hypothetical protein BGZ59_005039 [Podila verticillata]KFH71019.1 hypothetical protein MVEG_03865 [Podila verticillata NRRL 6337]